MSVLSSREWAILIWFILFFIYVLLHKQCRQSFLEISKIFFGGKLTILFFIIVIYVTVVTLVFYCLPIWNSIYIKDIVIWFLFSGLFYSMNAVSNDTDEFYIKKVLKKNLKPALVTEFIINTFTFNIWIELIIIPVSTLIFMMNIIAERKKEYEKVHRFLDIIIAIAGFWILFETIKIGLKEYKELNIFNTFISFMIPIVYMFLIIPLEYLLEVYSKYESLFVTMSFKENKNKNKKRKHCWFIIKNCKLSVRKILLFKNKYLQNIYQDMTEDEFKKMMIDFKIESNK